MFIHYKHGVDTLRLLSTVCLDALPGLLALHVQSAFNEPCLLFILSIKSLLIACTFGWSASNLIMISHNCWLWHHQSYKNDIELSRLGGITRDKFSSANTVIISLWFCFTIMQITYPYNRCYLCYNWPINLYVLCSERCQTINSTKRYDRAVWWAFRLWVDKDCFLWPLEE